MASHAIQSGQQLPASVEEGRLTQLVPMAHAAGGLNVSDWQERLLPGQRGLVSIGYFRRSTLAPMADDTSPIRGRVRNPGVGTERLRHGRVGEASLGDALMTRRATVDDVHLRDPDLVDFGPVIRQQAPAVSSRLGKAHIAALVPLPLSAQILDW